MAMNVCPADRVQAQVELVWELLKNPAGYGRFWDLTVERVEPEGPAAAGQRLTGWSRALCRRWRIDGEIVEVDASGTRSGSAWLFSSGSSATTTSRASQLIAGVAPSALGETSPSRPGGGADCSKGSWAGRFSGALRSRCNG